MRLYRHPLPHSPPPLPQVIIAIYVCASALSLTCTQFVVGADEVLRQVAPLHLIPYGSHDLCSLEVPLADLAVVVNVHDCRAGVVDEHPHILGTRGQLGTSINFDLACSHTAPLP